MSVYETEKLLEQYLLFHYGEEKDLMPFSFGPKTFHFPIKCVTDCLDIDLLPKHASGLDLGCAVGRTSFELARHCKKVLGIDNSESFIRAANQILHKGQLRYQITEEGTQRADRVALRPSGVDPIRLEFKCVDAMEFVKKKLAFDVVVAANLICRLKDPLFFLKNLSNIVSTHGQLILTSPYSWLEEFTPPGSWLDDKKKPLEHIQDVLRSSFTLKKVFDLPFLIREHYRKYQWDVSQVTLWQKIAI